MNDEQARSFAASCDGPVVVLDSERRVVAASEAAAAALDGLEPGRRLGEELAAGHPGLLVLFLQSPPELSAYQELRAGFTAAVSHELRTPLARLLVLLETQSPLPVPKAPSAFHPPAQRNALRRGQRLLSKNLRDVCDNNLRLARYRAILPDTATVLPSYCCGLENCDAPADGIKAVKA